MAKSFATLAVLTALLAACLFGVNSFTAPIIEANNAGAALGILKEVMPEAGGFTLLYDAANPGESTLKDVAATVKQVYAENDGKGYAINLSTTQGYTHDPIEFTVGFTADGKICGTLVTLYSDTMDFNKNGDYPSTYIGEDSTLANVQLVGGVTYSSSAFKGAVNDGFATLIANDLVGEAQKSPTQIFTELLPTLATGFANHAGILQAEEFEVGFAAKAFKALNNTNCAYIVDDCLVVVNTTGNATAYDLEGKVVAGDQTEIGNCIADAAGRLANTVDKDQKKAAKLAGSENLTLVELGDTHSSVVSVFAVDGGKKYAVVARPYHYSNEPMFYCVIVANGAIEKISYEEFILHSEYYSVSADEAAYKAGFAGLTLDTVDANVEMISGATFTSGASYDAAKDALKVVELLKGAK